MNDINSFQRFIFITLQIAIFYTVILKIDIRRFIMNFIQLHAPKIGRYMKMIPTESRS